MADQDLAYVDEMYAAGDDPWRIEDGFYERRKAELLLAGLTRPRFARAFEPACASGRLTAELVGRCDQLLAADVSARAVELTQARVPAADVRQLQLPQDWPEGQFDLIVLSEFGYYLPLEDWRALVARTCAALAPDWVVLACHWKHPFPKRLTGTEQLHAELAEQLPGRQVLSLDDEDFALAVWTGVESSVAAADHR